jgi:hypothetical protein
MYEARIKISMYWQRQTTLTGVVVHHRQQSDKETEGTRNAKRSKAIVLCISSPSSLLLLLFKGKFGNGSFVANSNCNASRASVKSGVFQLVVVFLKSLLIKGCVQ